MIVDNIKEELKEAMKSKDSVKTDVLKGLVAGFTNELVANGKTPQDSVDDELALTVINRAAKQRKDSIEQFEKGGRNDLADAEKTELEIIQGYLPEMMSEDDIRKVVEAKKSEMDIEGKESFGKLMGPVMTELKGKADGAVVKKVIDEVL